MKRTSRFGTQFEQLECRALLSANSPSPMFAGEPVESITSSYESKSVLPESIQVTGSRAFVQGTVDDDVIIWRLHESRDAPLRHRVTINGESHLLPAGVRRLEFHGNGASDTFSGIAGSGDDRAKIAYDATTILGDGYYVAANAFSRVFVDGGAGDDEVEMIGSDQADRYVARREVSRLTNPDFHLVAKYFEKVDARAGDGYDTAVHFDSDQTEDLFSASADRTFMRDRRMTYENRGWGFEDVTAISETPSSLATGQDFAYIYDRASDDLFVARHDQARLTADDGRFSTRVVGFTRVHAHASVGTDRAVLYDRSEDSDLVAVRPTTVRIGGSNFFFNVAHNFDTVAAVTSDARHDHASVFDGPGDDSIVTHPRRVRVVPASGTITTVSNVNLVRATSEYGGIDTIHLHGNEGGDDRFVASPREINMRSVASSFSATGYQVETKGFARVIAYGNKNAFDAATFHDGPGTESVTMTDNNTQITDINTGSLIELKSFSRVFVQLGEPSLIDGTSADLATMLYDRNSEVVEGAERVFFRALDGSYTGTVTGATFLTVESTDP